MRAVDYLLGLWNIFLIIFLVFLNGFFVAAEFAIVKIRSSRLETLIQEGNSRAVYAKRMTDHLDAYLSVTQLGITLASLGLGWIGEPAVAKMLAPVFHWLRVPPAMEHTLAFAVGFTLITALHIVLGELLPKSLAIQRAEGVVLWIALPMIGFYKLFSPAVWVLNSIAGWLLKKIGIDAAHEADTPHTEEEIRLLLSESHKQGYIDNAEMTMMDNVFDFSDRYVKEIMVPRMEVVYLYAEDSLEENMAVIREYQFTRYPLCEEDKDNIIGFIHVKDIMAKLMAHEPVDLKALARPVHMVPELMLVSKFLKEMQMQRSQIAVVMDEYGGVSGIVTAEDAIEEIVGEIQDEFDEEREPIEKQKDGTWSVDAKVLVEKIDDEFGIRLEAENIDTLGGWLYSQIEMPPQAGKYAESQGYRFTVEEVDSMRILRIHMEKKEPVPEEENPSERQETE